MRETSERTEEVPSVKDRCLNDRPLHFSPAVTFTAAIIGAGAVGAGLGSKRFPMTHAASYSALKERVTVSAFVETEPDRRDAAARAYPGIPVFETIDKMLAHVRPDIVSVCTPDDSHVGIIMNAFAAGARGIWCEKPMAMTARDAAAVHAQSRETGIPVRVNYFRRHIPELEEVRRGLTMGTFGKLESISGIYPERFIHHGCHLLDLLQYFAGDVTLESARGIGVAGAGRDGPVEIRLVTASGVPCTLIPSQAPNPSIPELVITTDRVRVEIMQNGREYQVHRVRQNGRTADVRAVPCSWDTSFTRALDSLIHAVSVPGVLTDTEDSVRIARIIDAIAAEIGS